MGNRGRSRVVDVEDVAGDAESQKISQSAAVIATLEPDTVTEFATAHETTPHHDDTGFTLRSQSAALIAGTGWHAVWWRYERWSVIANRLRVRPAHERVVVAAPHHPWLWRVSTRWLAPPTGAARTCTDRVSW